MNKFVSRFVEDESGATAIEYGLIAVGTNLKGTFNNIAGNVSH
jgi:Flp pilus assembly pilin Flp